MSDPSPPPSRTPTGPGLAALGGWLLGALVDAGFIAASPWPRAGASTRLLHHVHDLGHFLALGLVAAAGAHAWARWGPRGRVRATVGLAAVATLVGAAVLPEDLHNFSRSIPGPPLLVMAGLVVAVAAIVPAAALLGRLLVARGLRWLALGLGVAVFAVNNLVLTGDYKGGHFMFACAAAALGAAGLRGLPRRGSPRLVRALVVAGALLAAFSVVVRPPQSVYVQAALIDGDVLAPQLARLRETSTDEFSLAAADIPEPLREWFHDRASHPPIPPSSPRLVPADAIVVVVSVDSMRADVLTDDRYRATMPRLVQLFDRSVQFTRARAPGSTTRAVIGSILTGKHRTQLNWANSKQLQWHLTDDDTEQLVEQLHRAGIRSLHAISFSYLQKKFQFVRGYDEEVFVEPADGQRFALAEATLAPVHARLAERPGGPQFLWAHLMDAHYPYDAAGTRGTDFERYIAELGLVDAAVGRLWDEAERLGLLDRLVLVFTADHGEGFGQHNTPNHGITLYEELVRVPLAIRVPGVAPRVVDDPVSLIDLGPTILDLFGLPTPGEHMGQSLVPYLRGASPALTRPIAGVTLIGDVPVYYLMLSEHEKVIWNRKHGTREIYDLAADPREELNLYDSLGDEGAARFARLRAFYGGHPYFADKKAARPGKKAP